VDSYCDWRFTVRLLSPLGTLIQSDTLFGHICWQIAYAEGHGAVGSFLEPFLAGQPPFILSDAFPFGLLPRPLLPRPAVMVRRTSDYAARRRWDKASFVTAESFDRLRRGQQETAAPVDSPWSSVKTPHAAIDRLSDCTGGEHREAGRFYHTSGWALPDDPRVHIYLRCRPGWEQRVLDCLRAIGQVGFGRDKSQGFGQISVESLDSCDAFHGPDNANAFVALSTFVPATGDPTDGRWRLRVKRGALGEHAAGNPFKRPLLQMEPGSVFRAGPDGVRSFYGRAVTNIAPAMPAAIQCGFTIAAPCQWPTLDETDTQSEGYCP
jgi:CRISPR-associated protein Csm4